jgi:hypothetical protein
MKSLHFFSLRVYAKEIFVSLLRINVLPAVEKEVLPCRSFTFNIVFTFFLITQD